MKLTFAIVLAAAAGVMLAYCRRTQSRRTYRLALVLTAAAVFVIGFLLF
jgi:hypothetical protein